MISGSEINLKEFYYDVQSLYPLFKTTKIRLANCYELTEKFSSGGFRHKQLAASIHLGWTKDFFSFTAQRDLSVPASMETTCVTDWSTSVEHVAPNCSANFHKWWFSGWNCVGNTRVKTILQPFNISFRTCFSTCKNANRLLLDYTSVPK